MEFASDITDQLQLPSPTCSCAANTAAVYNTTRTSRFSYEKLYRIQRKCSKNAVSPYVIKEVCIDNTISSGYAIGDYIQVDYGTPSLLLYVTDVYPPTGEIYGIQVVNRPTFYGLPGNPLRVTTLSGSGTGAIVYVTMMPLQPSCCGCPAIQSCSGPFEDTAPSLTPATMSEEPQDTQSNCN
jgi:hypothetical protein